jgi:PAS domain S-box-containing protein
MKKHTGDKTKCSEGLPDGSIFRAAFETSRAVMFLIDPADGRIISANPAACDFYGYDPAEVDGMSPTEISLLPQERLKELLRRLLATGGARYSSRHKLKSGEVRDVELDAAPITLQDGSSCLFFIGHDITDGKQAARSLAQREALLRAILDSAGDGISFRDASGLYREANPAFCRMVGLPCDEVLGRQGKDFFDRRAGSRNVQIDRRILTDRSPVTYEMTQDAPDGPHFVSVHKSPVYDATGECLGVVSISRDITRRRHAEDALRKSEGLLRAMLHSAQDCIVITDEDDVIRELNQTFCQHVGRSRKELLDHPLAAAFQDEELRIQLSTNALARETREPVSFTQRMLIPGQELWISIIKTVVFDNEGRCLGVLSMGRDISAQRSAELALRQSERRLAGLIRQAPVGVFETDPEGALVFANERMQTQTGKPLPELLGEGWIERILPEDREDFLVLWRVALNHRREVDCELRLVDALGLARWMSCRIRPITDSANRLSGYLGVLGDISERKKAETLRDDVESVVRHDLKSPLGSVQNAMELLELLGPLNAEQAQVVGEVRALTRRMQALIALSLDLHAMEVGVFTPSLCPVDLCAVVDDLRGELRVLVEGKSLRLVLRSNCPAGPFYVRGERRLLDAVLSNLLKNAAEASPDGEELSVELSLEGGTAVVVLRNKGEVPPDVRSRFFDKYATSGKTHGTGLGTYSARLMVRTMGGSIALRTDEPGHTSLILRLPASPPPLPPEMPGMPTGTPSA